MSSNCANCHQPFDTEDANSTQVGNNLAFCTDTCEMEFRQKVKTWSATLAVAHDAGRAATVSADAARAPRS